MLKADGTPWVCSFDDEFNDIALDSSKWNVQTTARSGYHTGPECFLDNPNNVAEYEGTLKLTVRKEASPFTCSSPTGNYSTSFSSGMVSGYDKFSQTYGRFEVRAKLPAATVRGLQEALWLWPVDGTKYGTWPLSGEIDFGEFYSVNAGWNIPFIHYGYLQSTVSWLTNTNVYTALPGSLAQPGMSCAINQAGWNTYTVLWVPGQITLQVNNQNCIVNNYVPTNVASPAPFDQPFFLSLTQSLGVNGTTNSYVEGVTPLPATTEVDYVRIWK